MPLPSRLRKLIETVWIVDQDAALHGSVRHHPWNQIDQVTIVRHVPGDVRMRPVGAPEDPIRRRGDQCLRERHRIRERRSQTRYALRAAGLYPAPLIAARELEQPSERRLR